MEKKSRKTNEMTAQDILNLGGYEIKNLMIMREPMFEIYVNVKIVNKQITDCRVGTRKSGSSTVAWPEYTTLCIIDNCNAPGIDILTNIELGYLNFVDAGLLENPIPVEEEL